jgi:hypothetical protein
MLRPKVSCPVCTGIRNPPGVHDQICITVRQLRVYIALSSSSSYIAIDGQSASSSWCRAPNNFLCLTFTSFLLHVGRTLWRVDASVICSAITHWLESRRTHKHILLSHLRLTQPGGPGPRIYIPPEQGGPVIPRTLGSFYVASYDSQGNGGGILTPSPHGELLRHTQSQS